MQNWQIVKEDSVKI